MGEGPSRLVHSGVLKRSFFRIERVSQPTLASVIMKELPGTEPVDDTTSSAAALERLHDPGTFDLDRACAPEHLGPALEECLRTLAPRGPAR